MAKWHPGFGIEYWPGSRFLAVVDVRTSSDGIHYLLHDRTLEGRTDGTGPIEATPSRVIEKLSAGVKFGRPYASLRLPPLDQFFDSVGNRVDLYFDAKAIAPEALTQAVARHHREERTVVYQTAEYLLRLKAINPLIRALPPSRSPDEL